MRISYFSPMPPERSGIADYSALLVPELRQRADLVVARRGKSAPVRGSDVAVYHIGNNPEAHGWIVAALERSDGIVVLHDFVLHHLISGITLGRGKAGAYLDALERDGGLAARLLGHAVIEKRIPPLWEHRPQDFPLAGPVLDRATGLIVHSRYVAERARASGYAGPIRVVAHPAWAAPDIAAEARHGSPLIGAFGNINESKRVPQLLEAFAALRRAHPDARLLLVGATSPGFDLDRRLLRLGLDDGGVEREPYVDERRLWALMKACDVHVNLRTPTMGETSGTAVRALAVGRPLIVSNVGWFAELPDDVAIKIDVDADEERSLVAALSLLAERADVRVAMGVAATALARAAHSPARAAEAIVAFCEAVAGGRAISDAVVGEIASAAAGVGIEAGSPEARELARRLGEAGLGTPAGLAEVDLGT